MTIKGLTDNIKETFPVLGKLRKGAKKTNPKKPGDDLTYFRFTSDRSDVLKAFSDAYDGQPTLINVFLPYPNAEPPTQDGEGNFSAWCEQYNASGTLLHRCDGEYVVRQFEKDGRWTDPKPGTVKCPGGCHHVARLSVIIPELMAAGLVGYVTFETHSKHDIMSILGSLLTTQKKRGNHPDGLMGIAFTLQRVNQTVSSPSWKKDADPAKRHKVEKSLVKLTPSVTWVQAQLQMAQRAALPATVPDWEQPETPGETLARGNELLHGTGDEDIDTVTGEIMDDEPRESEPPAQPVEETAQGDDDEARLSHEQQAAYYFTLPSGKMLGQCGIDELLELKDWCSDRPNHASAQVTLLHVNVMLDYAAPHTEI